MIRRTVIAALALSFTLWAADAGAQEGVHRIGVLTAGELSTGMADAWLGGCASTVMWKAAT